MHVTASKRTPIFIALGVVVFFSGISLLRLHPVRQLKWVTNAFERLECMTYDWRVQLAHGRSSVVATNLGLVLIQDESIKALQNGALGLRYGLYWPRHIYGRVVRELKMQGAEAVAFDVMFGESRPDHSPISVAGSSVESDDFLGTQMRSASNVILAATKGVTPPGLFRTNAAGIGDIETERDDVDGVLRRARAFRAYRIRKWHTAFEQAAVAFGFDLDGAVVSKDQILLPQIEGGKVPIALDVDGNFDLADFVGDKIPPGFARKNKPFVDREIRVWSLGIVLAAQALKLDLEHAEVDDSHGRIVLNGPDGVRRVIPVDANHTFYIDWELTHNDPRLSPLESFHSLIAKDIRREQGEADPAKDLWKGKLAVVGSIATGNDLTDRGATALEKDTPLMSEHSNVANSIITGRYVTRAGVGVEICLVALLGLASALLTWRLRTLAATTAVLASVVGYVAAAAWVYLGQRYWLPIVIPAVCSMCMTHVALVTYRVMFEQDEKRRVKAVFSRCVSPNIVNELLRVEHLSLDGTRREITVLFADVRGFTELTDTTYEKALREATDRKLGPAEADILLDDAARRTLETVNQYLGMLADIVKEHDGTFDKFIGDCVMAFWGAPTPQPQHATAAVRAAIDAQRAIFRLNLERLAENGRRESENQRRQAAGQPALPLLPVLQMGSGINTGPASVGLMGSDAHNINYTVFGREVNLASRLEGVSGRGRIIIGEATFKHLQHDDPRLAATCVTHDPVPVKGFQRPVPIYEVPWQDTPAHGAGAPALAGTRPAPGNPPTPTPS